VRGLSDKHEKKRDLTLQFSALIVEGCTEASLKRLTYRNQVGKLENKEGKINFLYFRPLSPGDFFKGCPLAFLDDVNLNRNIRS